MTDYRPLRAGDVLRAHTGGLEWNFESFGAKTVEGIGDGWVVCREITSGRVLLFTGDKEDLVELR